MVSAPCGSTGPMREFFKRTWGKYQMQYMPRNLLFRWKQTGPLRCLQQAEAIPDHKRVIILQPHAFSKSSELEIIPEAICKGLAPREQMERYHPTRRHKSHLDKLTGTKVLIPGLPLSKKKNVPRSPVSFYTHRYLFPTPKSPCTYTLSKPKGKPGRGPLKNSHWEPTEGPALCLACEHRDETES